MLQRSKKTKSSFTQDDQGRTILGSAKEMADWVKICFYEQDKKRNPDIPFQKNYIDLSNCVLYVSYPIGSKKTVSQIFNLCDLAGIVPGIEKIEGDSNYLFEVKYDIHLDGSVLYGNFFHYVKFDGNVILDGATVLYGMSSCFKCFFGGHVYMLQIHLKGGFSFEQCEFSKGLIMHGAEVGGINAHFNNSIFKECLSLSESSFVNQPYTYSIELSNCIVENFNISRINTDGISINVQDSSICGIKMNNLKLDGSVRFYSCILEGMITLVKDEESSNNQIKELLFHSCTIKAQYHIENSDIDILSFSFGKVENDGRFRLSQSKVKELLIGSSSVFGQMDLINNKLENVNLIESCVPGYLNSQGNEVEKYENRQTLRLLKNEAIKINDHVSAIHLYAQEMRMLLSDKSVSKGDKVSLWFCKFFSDFGESWAKAIVVTLGLSIVLTLLMLGFGSAKYMFNTSGTFIRVAPFVTILLDSINVFSIPLFSETIKEYDLNVLGQILYFVIKLVVAYGSYQFIVAFRKHGRGSL